MSDDESRINDGVKPESNSIWPMVVLFLLTLLVLGWLGERLFTKERRRERAALERAEARSALKVLRSVVKSYQADTGRDPSQFTDLTKSHGSGKGPWITEVPKDSWGNDFELVRESGRVLVISRGADGLAGGADMDADLVESIPARSKNNER